jgi:dienelactone hydrolase
VSSRPRSLPALALAAFATACLAACAAPPSVPGPSGSSVTQPAGVAAIDLQWHDAARDRTVPARLYLPEASTNDQLPLVVFSHGLGGSRAGYAHLGRHWASEGFASLHVQHPGSDRALWRGDGPFVVLRNLQAAATTEHAIDRARDLSHALDSLLDDPTLGARIDRARIAVAGHSYGANTALLLAGARFDDLPGVPRTLRDPRVRAAVLMSVPPFPVGFDTASVLSDVGVPTLHLTTVDDVIRVPGHGSTPADRIALYETLSGAPKWLAVFGHGGHGVFTDRGGDPVGDAVKRATRDVSTAFLRTVMLERHDALDDALRVHAPLIARRASAPTAR